MSKSELDLQVIRTKLLQQQALQRGTAASSSDPDWLPKSQAPLGSADWDRLANTVEALKQRSTPPPSNPNPPSEPDWANHPIHQQIDLHRQRLHRIAEHINALSVQQERAMLEMQAIAERWEHEVEHVLATIPAKRYSSLETELFRGILHDYDSAVLAWATFEAEGCIELSSRPVAFSHPLQEAHHMAQTLRKRQTSIGPSAWEAGIGWQALLAEPLEGLSSFWLWASESISRWWQALVSDVTQGDSSHSLSLLNILIWLGGGIISRLALNFALNLYPGLWSLAVAGVTGITAYALYRATLAPRLEFGLAYRVLLAVVGLIVGGRM